MAKYLFTVGDIVSFNIHPYYQHVTDILIGGEPLQTPPLMIIIEVFRKRESVDIAWEDDSVESSCKCIWYSSRHNKYQSDWVNADLLKIISSSEKSSIVVGNLVALSTIYIELGKKKSSLSVSDDSDEKTFTSITPLLSFLPPIMQVLSIDEFKVKKHEPLGDENGIKYREVPKTEAKCVWYNPDADKFSQVALPTEVVLSIVEISSTVLQSLNIAIASPAYYHIEGKLVKPQSITTRSGLYFLRAYDLVQNAVIEISIHNKITLTQSTAFRSQAPKFDTDAPIMVDEIQTEIKEVIKGASQNNSFLRLQYRNRNDKVTKRTLKDYVLQEFEESDKKITFLTGYCFLRKEKRTFRLERIQNLQELDLSFK